jgi:hypothetical protein
VNVRALLGVVALGSLMACASERPAVLVSPGPSAVATPDEGPAPIAVAEVPVSRAVPLAEAAAAVSPVRLRIPSLDVDAPVVPVDVDRAGVLEVPPAQHVGWYRAGPSPGAPGSAVLAAHVDQAGRPGVFYGLVELVAGRVVEVELDDGTLRRFVVAFVAQHPKGDLPAAAFRRGGAPGLVLVTCGGDFDPDARRYRDNVVVYAEPVGTA